MNRDKIALEIYIKRLSVQYITHENIKGVQSQAAVAYELADIFLAEKSRQHEAAVLSEQLRQAASGLEVSDE